MNAASVRWTWAFCPQAWQWLPISSVPQLRQALSWKCPLRPSPAAGSTARA